MSISFQISILQINMNCFLTWLNNSSETVATLKSYLGQQGFHIPSSHGSLGIRTFLRQTAQG